MTPSQLKALTAVLRGEIEVLREWPPPGLSLPEAARQLPAALFRVARLAREAESWALALDDPAALAAAVEADETVASALVIELGSAGRSKFGMVVALRMTHGLEIVLTELLAVLGPALRNLVARAVHPSAPAGGGASMEIGIDHLPVGDGAILASARACIGHCTAESVTTLVQLLVVVRAGTGFLPPACEIARHVQAAMSANGFLRPLRVDCHTAVVPVGDVLVLHALEAMCNQAFGEPEG